VNGFINLLLISKIAGKGIGLRNFLGLLAQDFRLPNRT
jgi:hypothetical protein